MVVRAGLPSTIRIGLTHEFANRDSIVIGNNNISVGYDNNGAFLAVTTLQSTGGFTARVTGGVVTLHSGGQQVHAFDSTRSAQIRDAGGGTVSLGGYSYRGVIELRQSGGRLTAINVLCPEEYLYGVLPTEMSHSFHINALRAQAIASRTFMLYRMNEASHIASGFHLCDGTHCQSYRGANREHATTTQAVGDTRGLMMFHSNAPILAVYFASSGGSTDNSENVWVQTRPYLRAVQDIHEHDPVEWTRTFTWAEITQALQATGANIGTATGLSITGTNQFGRVQEITITGTSGTWRLNGEQTRTFFASIGGTLMSRNFHVAGAQAGVPAVSVTDGARTVTAGLSSFFWQGRQTVVYVFDGITTRRVDVAGTGQDQAGGNGVTLIGSGWGHGIGMSQRGAHGMALAGYTYRQILLHFYTDVEIR